MTWRLRDGTEGWGVVSRALHWGMAGLILFQLALGVWMVRVPDLIRRFDLTQLHKSWGTVVFLLALLRILWRALAPARPALPAAMPVWQRRAAGASHLALYALMLLLPLSGWILASASPTQDLLHMQNSCSGAGRCRIPSCRAAPRSRRRRVSGMWRPPGGWPRCSPCTPAPRSGTSSSAAMA